MKKLLALSLAAVMSLSLLVGCGGKDTGNEGGNEATGPVDVTLKVWCPQNQIDSGTISQQQAAFAEANKDKWNITWETEVMGEDVCKENLLRDVEAAADVFMFASDQITELVNAGAIAKLGGDAAAMVEEEIAASVSDTAKVNGELYGIPFTHNTYFMFYDKTLMTEEDIKTIEGIVNKDTDEDVYNFYFESGSGWKLGAWYYGAGLRIYGEKGDDLAAGCDWNSETGVAVTEYLIDLIANKKVAYDGEISVSELIDDHRLGVWFDGSWNYDMYKEVLGDDLGLATIPTYNLNGVDTQLLSFYSSKCIGVNAHSDNMGAAVAFATFLGNAENQTLRFELSHQTPASTVAGASDAVQADEVSQVIMAESDNCAIEQPYSAIFSSRYWANAGTIPTEIRSGIITKDNVQEKLDKFVEVMTMPE